MKQRTIQFSFFLLEFFSKKNKTKKITDKDMNEIIKSYIIVIKIAMGANLNNKNIIIHIKNKGICHTHCVSLNIVYICNHSRDLHDFRSMLQRIAKLNSTLAFIRHKVSLEFEHVCNVSSDMYGKCLDFCCCY